jgi:hypothetical protein
MPYDVRGEATARDWTVVARRKANTASLIFAMLCGSAK